MKYLFLLALSLTFPLLLIAEPEKSGGSDVIVFDLGGVLVDTDPLKTFKKLGIGVLVRYFFEQRTDISAKIQCALYKTLAQIESSVANYCNVCDMHGHQLPPLMVEWLTGKTTNKQILDRTNKWITAHPEQFTSVTEQTLIRRLVHIMFTPALFIETRKKIEKTVQFMSELYNKRNNRGERFYKIYICSNWDQESFALLKQSFPQLFQCCDGFIISGQEGILKPDKLFYQRLQQRFIIDPSKNCCIFIDDQKENRETAKMMGFIAFHPDEIDYINLLLKITTENK